MTLSNILLGLATGIPLMIVVGPVALLLIEQGMERGMRGGLPAICGVVAADVAFSVGTALAGVAISTALEPLGGLLQITSVAVLLVVAVRLWMSARTELRAAAGSSDLAAVASLPAAALAPAGAGALNSGAPSASIAEQTQPSEVGPPEAPAGRPLVRAGGFFLFTLLNPVAIALMATVVLAGGEGTGSAGWVVGMCLSSVMVSTLFVAVGHVMGSRLSEVAVGRTRLAAAVLIAAMAVHFALG